MDPKFQPPQEHLASNQLDAKIFGRMPELRTPSLEPVIVGLDTVHFSPHPAQFQAPAEP